MSIACFKITFGAVVLECRSTSRWTPSIVPGWADQMVYLVENDFGRLPARDAHHSGLCTGWHRWDGIYVGRRKRGDLVYAGKVDHGFDKQSAADLRKRLTPLIRKTQPYNERIAHKGIWVEPELFAEVEYRAKSAEGKVRHPFFKGVKEDV